jgi:hypothetical protein
MWNGHHICVVDEKKRQISQQLIDLKNKISVKSIELLAAQSIGTF